MQARKESAEDGGLDESEDRREMGMYANLVGEYERSGVVKKALMALALVTMMGIAMAVVASPAHADIFTVTSTADDNSPGTLRAAINAANTTPENDAITFNIPASDSGCTSTDGCIITPGSTLPPIEGDLIIEGKGNRITLSGNDAVRVLDVRPGAQLNLKNLTVANGRGRTDNFFTSGGGIYNNGGTLTVTNSTFSQNSAKYSVFGGGIGGGIYNDGGTATLGNTIVANSSGGNCSGSISDRGGNLADDDSCKFSTSTQNSANVGLDPEGLKDNGGPTQTIALKPTSAAIDAAVGTICAASPVNNLDQRGIKRPQGKACDIGAFELDNVAPVATGDDYSTDEDTTLTVNAAGGILANDTDADKDILNAFLVSEPAHGTLTLNQDGSFKYIPERDYYGPDSFTYKANDGKLGSDEATVNINVNAVDDNPLAVNDTSTVAEDAGATTINVLANDTDIDNGPKSIQSVTQPTNGTVAITNGGSDLTYKPNADYCNDGSPTDDFNYTLNGGSSARVAVKVTCVNDAPVAREDSYNTNEDNTLTVAAPGVLQNDTDVDSTNLTAAKVLNSGPSHGSLTLNTNGSFTYTPDANYSGPDSFTYIAKDASSAESNQATVNITVNPVNDAPTVAVSGGACLSDTAASGRLDFTVADVDSPLNNLTLKATSLNNTSLIPNANLVTGGSGANRTLSLSAAPKKSGTAIIKVTVSDGQNNTDLPVTIKVGTSASETITGTEGADVIFGLGGSGTLGGAGGPDLICGGNGNDEFSGGSGNDVLDGGRGDDKLNGGEGNDRLLGNAGIDRLTGGAGADFFSGGAGEDTSTDYTASQGDTRDGS